MAIDIANTSIGFVGQVETIEVAVAALAFVGEIGTVELSIASVAFVVGDDPNPVLDTGRRRQILSTF